MKYLLLTAILLTFILNSCGPGYLFQEEKNIPEGNWRYADTLNFTFSVTDTSALYHILVNFHFADTFPYQNMYVKFHTLFPDGKRLSKPLSFDLFDPVGNPTGKCSGGTCSAQIPIQENAFFEKTGDYTITLEQFGRQDPLPGVKSVGLRVQRAGSKNMAKK